MKNTLTLKSQASPCTLFGRGRRVKDPRLIMLMPGHQVYFARVQWSPGCRQIQNSNSGQTK